MTSSDTEARSTATMWFDPACPWAWMTSRWLKQVETVRDVNVRYEVMSLAVLNDVATDANLWRPVRVAIAVRNRHGDDAVDNFYTALGTRFHPGKEERNDATIAAALDEIRLPAELIDAAADSNFDDEVRQSTAKALELVGDDVGTPVVRIGDTAFFGPVVTPSPKGEDAGKLWDGCLLVANTPGFYELKRSRIEGPNFE